MATSKCEQPTKAELKWIEDFKKLAKKCPKSLWLFSAGGNLHVMKMPKNGNHARIGTRGEGINQENSLGTISIQNDGGDW